jgi:hypothetical protein
MPVRKSLKLLSRRRAWDEWDTPRSADDELAAPRSRKRRAFATLTFATLFFAGAAFSAGAGNQVRTLLAADEAASTATVDMTTTTTDAAPTQDPAAADPAPAAAPQPAAQAPAPSGQHDDGSDPAPAATPDAAAPASAPAPATNPAADSGQAGGSTGSSPAAHVSPAFRRRMAASRKVAAARVHGLSGRSSRSARHSHASVRPRPVELEGAASAGATVWLNRALPDPTPPALRLSRRYASELRTTARQSGVDWALVLGMLRAEGDLGSAPGGLQGLRRVSASLAGHGARANVWGAAYVVAGQTALADRAVALSHYYRAVGLQALVSGLLAQEKALGRRVLADPRVSIYSGGRGDIEANRVNVRVLAMIEYVADTFGQVTVSCLISGHRLYARPGVVSAHIYGLAADLSTVGGTPILGHQQPGSVTEQAVRAMLLLPPEMMPRQVISLLGLGGPSFPLDDHYNHIHVGY